MNATRLGSARPLLVLFALAFVCAAGPRESRAAALSAEMQKQLAESKYVYVSSQRKDGSFSPPAEIWFMVHDGAVWVGTRKTSWRARRIRAGRSAARVHAGSASGPAFDATAAIVDDPAVWKVLFDSLAKTYPDGWSSHEKAFRDGAMNGDRVLIRYMPK